MVCFTAPPNGAYTYNTTIYNSFLVLLLINSRVVFHTLLTFCLINKKRAFAHLCLYYDDVVPETGLEPAHLAAYAPKAYVYTNFTTRARVHIILDYLILGKKKYAPEGVFKIS